jgi:hypothetical protein
VALTVTTTPGRIGPGIRIWVNQSTVGPIPVDDWYFIQVFDTGTFNKRLDGSVLTGGLHSKAVRLGVYEHQVSVADLDSGMIDGGALDVVAVQYHANGFLVDISGTYSGWGWDASSGLWKLLSEGSDVSAILAAVRRSYSNH